MVGVYAPFITLSTPKNYWSEAKFSSVLWLLLRFVLGVNSWLWTFNFSSLPPTPTGRCDQQQTNPTAHPYRFSLGEIRISPDYLTGANYLTLQITQDRNISLAIHFGVRDGAVTSS